MLIIVIENHSFHLEFMMLQRRSFIACLGQCHWCFIAVSPHTLFSHTHTHALFHSFLLVTSWPRGRVQFPMASLWSTMNSDSTFGKYRAFCTSHLVLVVGLRTALWISRAVFPNLVYNWLRHIINGYFHERVFVLFFDWRWFVSFLSFYRYCVCEENARLENVRMKTVSLSI